MGAKIDKLFEICGNEYGVCEARKDDFKKDDVSLGYCVGFELRSIYVLFVIKICS